MSNDQLLYIMVKDSKLKALTWEAALRKYHFSILNQKDIPKIKMRKADLAYISVWHDLIEGILLLLKMDNRSEDSKIIARQVDQIIVYLLKKYIVAEDIVYLYKSNESEIFK